MTNILGQRRFFKPAPAKEVVTLYEIEVSSKLDLSFGSVRFFKQSQIRVVMKQRSILAFAFALLCVANFATGATIGSEDERAATKKQGKLVFLFNVVKFKNDPCASTSTLTR